MGLTCLLAGYVDLIEDRGKDQRNGVRIGKGAGHGLVFLFFFGFLLSLTSSK